jgi:6-pyruvoyltetrahydropterin/6-carboxytetrahydropterin synthase
MTEHYCVRIAKEELVFSAAHFITFAGDVCERLHGHNYGLAVEVAGPLDENSYVIDFIALREQLRAIVATLDHFVLLPTAHSQIRVVADEREVVATFDQRRWVFPRGDCVLLPVPNTTAEMLARHIGQQLLAALQSQHAFSPRRLRVEVDECQGQLGVVEWQE